MTSRNEVIAEPFEVYLQAFAGTLPTIPGVDDTPSAIVAAGWSLLGARGRKSQKREGVMVTHTPAFATFTGANETKVGDRWITGDAAMIELTLVDVRAEIAALALDQAVTVVAGTPSYKEFGLGRPLALKRWSVLLRGRTPENAAAASDRWRQLLYWDCQVTSPYSERPNLDAPGEVPLKFEPVAVDSVTDEVYKLGRGRYWSA